LDSLTRAGGTDRLKNVRFQTTEDPNGNSLCM